VGAESRSLSFRLAKALSSGRGERKLTRERILLDLLNKRAVARREGLTELEAQLREQIRWALPVRDPEGEGGAAASGADDGAPAGQDPPTR
jgi:hypothetical protein